MDDDLRQFLMTNDFQDMLENPEVKKLIEKAQEGMEKKGKEATDLFLREGEDILSTLRMVVITELMEMVANRELEKLRIEPTVKTNVGECVDIDEIEKRVHIIEMICNIIERIKVEKLRKEGA